MIYIYIHIYIHMYICIYILCTFGGILALGPPPMLHASWRGGLGNAGKSHYPCWGWCVLGASHMTYAGVSEAATSHIT